MHVALTGVSGFIGSVVARHLHGDGHTVAGLVRPTSRRDHVEDVVERFVVGEQSDDGAWPELLEGADCVIHNSADWAALKSAETFDRHLQSNLVGSIRLLRAAAPRPFVHLSSVAVHHDMLPRWQGRIDEDHPLRPGSWYGAYKAAVEAHLWTAWSSEGQRTCAIRPCAVYGIDPKLDRSIGYPILQRIAAERRYNRRGGGKFVHVDDVAAAVVAAATSADSAGRAYNLADCYARWADWAQMAAGILGVEAEIDSSSPPEPKNAFTKDAARSLGVALDRGWEGIRQHLEALAAKM